MATSNKQSDKPDPTPTHLTPHQIGQPGEGARVPQTSPTAAHATSGTSGPQKAGSVVGVGAIRHPAAAPVGPPRPSRPSEAPTPGEIRTVLADLLTLAEEARDSAGEPFNGGGRYAAHFAIRAGQALLPRLGR